MKKPFILLAALAFFGATPAYAAKGDTSFGLQFGGSVPTGDFSSSYKTGFEGGLVGTDMISEHVGVGVDVAFHAWGATDAANAQLEALLGPGWAVKLNGIQTSAHVQYNPLTRGKARPYAEVGWGLYWMKSTLYGPSGRLGGDRRSHFSYNAGVGVTFNVSPTFGIGVGGAYHSIESNQVGVPAAKLFTVGVSLLREKGAK